MCKSKARHISIESVKGPEAVPLRIFCNVVRMCLDVKEVSGMWE